jgi:ABC-type transporter Mla maintaining outer membrane lipid asymmetry permease subunit MlaE
MTRRRRAEARRARRRNTEPLIQWRQVGRGALLGIAVSAFLVGFVVALAWWITRP